jgi:hypothetical protein
MFTPCKQPIDYSSPTKWAALRQFRKSRTSDHVTVRLRSSHVSRHPHAADGSIWVDASSFRFSGVRI